MSGTYQPAIPGVAGAPVLTAPATTGGNPGNLTQGGPGGILVLDGSGDFSGVTIGAYAHVATSINALQAINPTTLVTGSSIDVLAYANQGDGGAGIFDYNASSTTAPDCGINFVPNNLTTTVTAQTLGYVTGKFFFSGTATASGVLDLTIGTYTIPVSVSSGNSSTAIASAAVIAVNGIMAIPGTATSSGSTVTFTPNTAGSYALGVSGLPAGVTCTTATQLSGTLSNTLIIPGSVTISCGGYSYADGFTFSGQTIGCGQLFGPNVLLRPSTSGTISTSLNTTNGSFSITPNVAPTCGTAIVATWTYASSAGRWKRRLADVNMIDPRMFGMQISVNLGGGIVDISYAVMACDIYASKAGKSIFLPTTGTAANFYAATNPIIVSTGHWFMEPGSDAASSFYCFQPASAPPDLTSMFTFISSFLQLENINVKGPDTLPTLSTLLSSNYVATQSTGTATLAGNTLTLTAAATGLVAGALGTTDANTIALTGDNCSRQIMALVSGTLGASGSTYTVSGAANTISMAAAFTQTLLPQYAALASGTAGIQIIGKGNVTNCTANGFKVGCVLNASQGHVNFLNCNTGGFIGLYCYDNGYDFVFTGGGFGGIWAGLVCGTTNVVGSAGGINANFFRVQFPLQAAYHIYQFQDATYVGNVSGVSGGFYGCSFESCNEACMNLLPSAGTFLRLEKCTQQWGGTALPAGLTPTPQQNLFNLGKLSEFYASSNQSNSAVSAKVGGSWAASTLIGSYPKYSLTAYMEPLAAAEMDFRFLDTNLNITYISGGNRWIGNYRSIDSAQKADFGVYRDLAYAANLVVNPEVATNWTNSYGTNTVTVSAYSSSDLAAIPLTQQMVEILGTNPSVIKVVTSGGNGTVALAANSALAFIGLQTPIWNRLWGNRINVKCSTIER